MSASHLQLSETKSHRDRIDPDSNNKTMIHVLDQDLAPQTKFFMFDKWEKLLAGEKIQIFRNKNEWLCAGLKQQIGRIPCKYV